MALPWTSNFVDCEICGLRPLQAPMKAFKDVPGHPPAEGYVCCENCAALWADYSYYGNAFADYGHWSDQADAATATAAAAAALPASALRQAFWARLWVRACLVRARRRIEARALLLAPLGVDNALAHWIALAVLGR